MQNNNEESTDDFHEGVGDQEDMLGIHSGVELAESML